MNLEKQVLDLKNDWEMNKRWSYVKRPYTAEEVVKLRGSLQPEYTLARVGAEKLWKMLKEEDYVHCLGTLTGGQAIQGVKAGAKAIYSRHTLQHHQFFTEQEMRFAGPHDWRVTLFPPYALAVFIAVLSAPGVLFLSWIFSPNVGWLFICCTTSFYLLYEIMHFFCHIKDNIIVRNLPFINTIRRHHAAHHNKGIMMGLNMNLTFPFGDWLFGTSDLNRGLWGHFFNGYNTKYIKEKVLKSKDVIN